MLDTMLSYCVSMGINEGLKEYGRLIVREYSPKQYRNQEISLDEIADHYSDKNNIWEKDLTEPTETFDDVSSFAPSVGDYVREDGREQDLEAIEYYSVYTRVGSQAEACEILGISKDKANAIIVRVTSRREAGYEGMDVFTQPIPVEGECRLTDCTNVLVAKGRCRKHYDELRAKIANNANLLPL